MKNNNDKKAALSKNTKTGLLSIAAIAVVTALAIILNVALNLAFPEGLEADLSDKKVYTVTDTSKSVLSELKEDVSIIVLSKESDLNSDKRIEKFLTNYTALSDKLSYKIIDPIQNPSALEKYGASEGDIVVLCESTGKSSKLTIKDLYSYDYSEYFTTGNITATSFDMEGQLTTAVNYVTKDAVKNIYFTSGHGESEFASSGLSDIAKLGVNVYSLENLNSIPENCNEIIIYGASEDISNEEAQSLEKYIDGGGNVMIFASKAQTAKTENLTSLMKKYGIVEEDGYLADMKKYYINSYFQFFVTFTKNNGITDDFTEDDKALIEYARPLKEGEVQKQGFTLNTFLETTFNTYAVTEDSQVMDTYAVGIMSEKEDGGSLTVIGSETLVDEDVMKQYTSFKNMQIVTNAISRALDLKNISIPAKSLEVSYNAVNNAIIIALPFMIIIPAALIIYGLVVWTKKKRR